MTNSRPDIRLETTDAKNRRLQSTVFRWLLIVIGWLAVFAGVVGIFLPLLPTVPLLLLAAACFSRSSESFHTWLVEHDRLGPLIRGYLGGAGIPRRAKAAAIGMVWVSVPVSAVFFVPLPWVQLLLLAIAAGITVYLLRLPTKAAHDENRQ